MSRLQARFWNPRHRTYGSRTLWPLYSDSDWVGSIDDRKSTGVYIFLLLGTAISWKVKLSQMACLSSQESEYCALSEPTKETLNLQMVMQQLGFGSMKATTIFCNN